MYFEQLIRHHNTVHNHPNRCHCCSPFLRIQVRILLALLVLSTNNSYDRMDNDRNIRSSHDRNRGHNHDRNSNCRTNDGSGVCDVHDIYRILLLSLSAPFFYSFK